jgi:hypothetical protein
MAELTPERLDEIEEELSRDYVPTPGEVRDLLALARRVVAPDEATVEAVAHAAEEAIADCFVSSDPTHHQIGRVALTVARAALAAVERREG